MHTETYYLRFKSELDRQAAANKHIQSPYYIEHTFWDRPDNEDYMMSLTIGHFFSKTGKSKGYHAPVGLSDADLVRLQQEKEEGDNDEESQ